MIKHLMLAFCALALTACGSTGALNTASTAIEVATSSTPIGDRVIMDEKAMSAAELFYIVPTQLYRTSYEAGLVSPGLRATVRPKLQKLYAVLKLVRQAYAVGDATSFSQRYNELKALKEATAPFIPGYKERN